MLLRQLKATKAFTVFLRHKGGFHAGKESFIGGGVSNIIIPPIIDCFSACTAITVSLCSSYVKQNS